jgi:hypothetical protein
MTITTTIHDDEEILRRRQSGRTSTWGLQLMARVDHTKPSRMMALMRIGTWGTTPHRLRRLKEGSVTTRPRGPWRALQVIYNYIYKNICKIDK